MEHTPSWMVLPHTWIKALLWMTARVGCSLPVSCTSSSMDEGAIPWIWNRRWWNNFLFPPPLIDFKYSHPSTSHPYPKLYHLPPSPHFSFYALNPSVFPPRSVGGMESRRARCIGISGTHWRSVAAQLVQRRAC